MKTSSLLAAMLFSMSGLWALAQSQSSAPNPPAVQDPARMHFYVVAEFTQSINAKKLKAGDKIKAEVTQDVLSHGKIVIPVESKLIGHVTEAKSRGANGDESLLGIVFDKILLRNHREVEFQGVIQSLEAPAPRRSKVDEPDQMLPPSAMSVSSGGGMAPIGGSGGRGYSSGSSSTSSMNVSQGAPVYMNGTPGSNAGNSVGGDLSHPSRGGPPNPADVASPLGAGMPLGVFQIKGLKLIPGPTSSTPGPVITSSTRDVKLDYGTQVLIKGSNPHLPLP